MKTLEEYDIVKDSTDHESAKKYFLDLTKKYFDGKTPIEGIWCIFKLEYNFIKLLSITKIFTSMYWKFIFVFSKIIYFGSSMKISSSSELMKKYNFKANCWKLFANCDG